MVRLSRKLTGAVLLASYIAATIGAWSHGRHDCQDVAQVGHSFGDYACHDRSHGDTSEHSVHRSCGETAEHLGFAEVAAEPLREAHSHHFDQCLICQFLAIQKVLELSSGSTPAVAVLTQRLAYPDHRLLVAERIGTPDSRGPPHA